MDLLLKHSSQQLYKHSFFQDHREGSQLLKPHLKTEKNQGERSLYEEPLKGGDSEGPGSIQQRIDLAITLVEQNDELGKMVALVGQQLNDESLKQTIFVDQAAKNSRQISELTAKLRVLKEMNNCSMKMENLNQSIIPNKSLQMNTTNNTNSWVNQLLSREDLESLWTQRSKVRLAMKKEDTPIKTYTLDLNAAVMSDRLQKTSKGSSSCNVREQSAQKQGKKSERVAERPKKTISSVAYKSRGEASKRYDLKIDMNEKQRKMAQMWEKTKSKPLSYLRNAKKARNPEL